MLGRQFSRLTSCTRNPDHWTLRPHARTPRHHDLRRSARARESPALLSSASASGAPSCSARWTRRSPPWKGSACSAISRLGKRVVLALDGDLFLVIHLMIAGRLRWRPRGAKVPKKRGLAGVRLRRRHAALHRGGIAAARGALDRARAQRRSRRTIPAGSSPLAATLATFRAALTRERHTLKRTLTDPHVFAGIGNAYSDEILHAARLSPLQLTTNLDDDEIARLHAATRARSPNGPSGSAPRSATASRRR